MEGEPRSDFNFTQQAEDAFQRAAERPDFQEKSVSLIYQTISSGIHAVAFCDYLKRYLYRQAGMTEPPAGVPDETYQKIILAEFARRQVPPGFEITSARLKGLSRNWLTQKTAQRRVVLLLGFGLGMSAEDVNEFLAKALQEPALSAKDPFESLCWYCYKNGLSYYHFDEMLQTYRALPPLLPSADAQIKTQACRRRLEAVSSREELMDYLRRIPVTGEKKTQSVTARLYFDRLYARTRDYIARLSAETAPDREALSAGHVTAADVERVLYAAIPKNEQGNLLSARFSALHPWIAEKRLTRQRINEILGGKAPITRYDLMTLNFFLCSLQPAIRIQQRYKRFLQSTNTILSDCAMQPIYLAHPYEAFLLLCMLTLDPLGSFSDVLERSFAEEET